MILDDYSVSRMADDYIAIYNKAVQKPYHILMSGYYGFHNAGDDAILNAIHRNLTQMDENLQVRVLIANPEEASQIYDYDMVSRFHIFGLLRAIHRCDLLISGGGSLLQDRTSTKIYHVLSDDYQSGKADGKESHALRQWNRSGDQACQPPESKAGGKPGGSHHSEGYQFGGRASPHGGGSPGYVRHCRSGIYF